jgi:glycosyltransferase involved in cell wall biosynthesis
MNSQPKISVIVPVYKTEGLLDRCVESIVGQTYKNLEIILVDDGSPDNCPAMCDEWAEKDSRIRVIHKENGGVSSARNAALDIATGDYIGFVDSDDWIELEMYSSLIQKISESGKNIALCSYYAVEISGERYECRCVVDKEVLDKDDYFRFIVLGGDGGYIWNRLYDADILKEVRFDEDIWYSEDLLFNFKTAQKSNGAAILDKIEYNYVQKRIKEQAWVMNDHSFDSMTAFEIMLSYKDIPEDVYDCCLRGYAAAAFTLLSGVLTNEKYFYKYDDIRSAILNFKKRILTQKKYPLKYKVKTLALWLCPGFYNFMIRGIRNAKDKKAD